MYFHTIPKKKTTKKNPIKKPLHHTHKTPSAIPFPAAHGERQTLSDISAGRQGGRFFPMGWRLPPYFQNTPLPKNPPSWASSTKGADPALGVSSAHIPSFSFYTQWPGNGTRAWGICTTNLCVAPPGLDMALLSSLALLLHLPNQLPEWLSYTPNLTISSSLLLKNLPWMKMF